MCCLLLGCSNPNPDSSVTLTIFAAASLTEAFTTMADAYEAMHPDTGVILNFAGSQTLRLQIEQGAKPDIFASADQHHLDSLIADKLVLEPVIFTKNKLVLIVPASNPAKIETIGDLAQPNIKLLLAGPQVPVGRYARQILANLDGQMGLATNFSAQVLNNLVSEEDNVKGVLAKVQLGEADAGIVYTSDVATANPATIKAIPIPTEFNVTARYPIVQLVDSNQPDQAQSFIAFVLSTAGQAILAEHGFGE